MVSQRGLKVLPVRPYARSIRERVFALLRAVKLEVDEVNTVPPGTTDLEAIQQIERLHPDVLLVPFHAHRDHHGAAVNGLELLTKIGERPRFARTPFVMPVSGMGEAAFDLLITRVDAGEPLAAALERTFLLREKDLDDRATRPRLAQHLARWLDSR